MPTLHLNAALTLPNKKYPGNLQISEVLLGLLCGLG
jgi:hypothetical protein